MRGLSIFLRLEVEDEGKRLRGVADPDEELMACFFEGVFTGVGKARSAEERDEGAAEVRGCEGAESKGEMREEDAWLCAAFLDEGLIVPGEEGERVLLGRPDCADEVE